MRLMKIYNYINKVKKLDILLSKEIDQILLRQGVPFNFTKSQIEVVMYLYHHQDQVVYQRELSDVLGITRPTANGLIKRLVQKDAVKLIEDPDDSRLKRIKLMPLVIADIDSRTAAFAKEFNQMEGKMTKGFTQKQRDELDQLLVRAIKNLEEK